MSRSRSTNVEYFPLPEIIQQRNQKKKTTTTFELFVHMKYYFPHYHIKRIRKIKEKKQKRSIDTSDGARHCLLHKFSPSSTMYMNNFSQHANKLWMSLWFMQLISRAWKLATNIRSSKRQSVEATRCNERCGKSFISASHSFAYTRNTRTSNRKHLNVSGSVASQNHKYRQAPAWVPHTDTHTHATLNAIHYASLAWQMCFISICQVKLLDSE